ncbi:glycosyltransferase family 61 protein [Pontimonas salivibrio]|nr:glycosyltransferase family 61 protein [Pontimonas salivibrio]
MDKWFEWLPQKPAQTMDAVEGLQTAYRARKRGFARGFVIETFTDWDLYRNFSQRPLSEVSEHIRGRFVPPHEPKPGDKPKAVVLIRDHVPDALTQHPTREFGPAKRNIPNLKTVAKSLEKHFSVELLDGSAKTPEETVAACSNADLLIGQHGAGLANALFLPPGAQVIEIGWNPVGSNPLGHFEALSAELGLGWKYLALQEDQFAPISAEDLERELLAYTDSPR